MVICQSAQSLRRAGHVGPVKVAVVGIASADWAASICAACRASAWASSLAAARASDLLHCQKMGMKPATTANSVEIHSKAPPAWVLDRVYMEAIGVRAERMASPRMTSGGPPSRTLTIRAP